MCHEIERKSNTIAKMRTREGGGRELEEKTCSIHPCFHWGPLLSRKNQPMSASAPKGVWAEPINVFGDAFVWAREYIKVARFFGMIVARTRGMGGIDAIL